MGMSGRSNNPVEDNLEFMEACGKPVPERPTLHYPSEEMQWGLIKEEFQETQAARASHDIVEVADGLGDMIKVILEYGESCGIPMQLVWDEIHKTNMAKVDPKTGKVNRRADGKILKPAGWKKPDIAAILRASGWKGEA